MAAARGAFWLRTPLGELNIERPTSDIDQVTPPGSGGLRGHLRLVCRVNARGESHLAEQSFCAPIHLSKPHLDAGTLVVNIVNPAAGLLAGDRIDVRVRVEGGARLLLTTPSANRVHRMREGFAAIEQEFIVAEGASLENWPELFIPQAGARYRQRTVLRVEEGGELLFFETLAPGRVASGESFKYDWLDWETNVFLGAELSARECYRLAPGSGGLAALQAQFANAYYASCFVVSPRLTPGSACWGAIHGLHHPSSWVGISDLAGGGWIIKVVADSSLGLRRVLHGIRHRLHAELGQLPPSLRRSTGE